MTELSLLRHPALPVKDGVNAVKVRVEFSGLHTGLKLAYEVSGDIDDVIVPSRQPAAPADRLWEHTCFEAFIRGIDENAYREFNFSPSTQWAVYGFARYREGMRPIALARSPDVEILRTPRRLSVSARLAGDAIPSGQRQTSWRVALCAVINTRSGGMSYWALRHSADKPDFHHPDSFTFNLESTPS